MSLTGLDGPIPALDQESIWKQTIQSTYWHSVQIKTRFQLSTCLVWF